MNDLKFTTAGDYMNTKMIENTDYEIIPNPDDSHSWQIRIIKGEFTESVIQFGTIAFNEVKDHFSFDFTLVYSPDEYLNIDNVDLHKTLGKVLEDIVENGHEEGWVKLNEKRPIIEN